MKRFLTLSTVRMSIEILLVMVLLMVALPNRITSQASAQQEPEAPTALYWYQCNTTPPNHVAVFTNRVHIWCTSTTPVSGAPALTGIYWFAFPTSPDSAAASRVMSIMQSAKIIGGTVWVEVNPTDTSGSAFGCGSGDCRRIYGIELR
jgi:hypothetical protein